MKTLKDGQKIGKATVHVDIVEKGNTEIRPAIKMVPKYTTYHNTGNKGKGANAAAHNKLMHNNAGKPVKDTSHVGWHLAVDHKDIYQHLPFDEIAWHCGDGNGPGNMSSIGIEICENSDMTAAQYAQAEENAIALGVVLAKAFNIPVKNHVPHQKWSGKHCPRVILNRDGSFTKFNKRIESAIKAASAPAVAAFQSKAPDGPARRVNVVTGALGRNWMLEMLDYVEKEKWSGRIETKGDGKNPYFVVGYFNTGSGGLHKLEKWLQERKWSYKIEDHK